MGRRLTPCPRGQGNCSSPGGIGDPRCAAPSGTAPSQLLTPTYKKKGGPIGFGDRSKAHGSRERQPSLQRGHLSRIPIGGGVGQNQWIPWPCQAEARSRISALAWRRAWDSDLTICSVSSSQEERGTSGPRAALLGAPRIWAPLLPLLASLQPGREPTVESSSLHCSLFWKRPYGLFSSAHLVSCHKCQDRQHRVDLSSWGSLASQAFSPGQVRIDSRVLSGAIHSSCFYRKRGATGVC